MKTLVLDGFNESGDLQSRAMEAAAMETAGRGWEVEVLTLREMELAPCTGCFGCWTRSPGTCVQEDHSHDLCQKIVASELILTLTPITFGGYSSTAKAAMDRTIGLVSPFFTMVGGEVHHEPRYERMPAMAVLGINHGTCDRCPDIFRTLIFRNAINFHPPAMAVEVAEEKDLTAGGLRAAISGLLDKVLSLPMSDLPVMMISREDFAPGPGTGKLALPAGGEDPRILFLTGSPRGRSTSSSIVKEFAARFARRGWQTQEKRIHPSLEKEGHWQNLTDSLARAHVVALVSPLYVDGLPAPVTRALERIALESANGKAPGGKGFMALLNCGFPEDFHNYTGLAIARRFAEETGYVWMGGLALGMGGAIDGRPLGECGRMVRNVIASLDLAAASLAAGDPIPAEAVDLMGKPFLPRWLYIIMGNWGWKKRARKHGVRQELKARPYAAASREGAWSPIRDQRPPFRI